jgi:hypothetical protein
LKGTSAAEAGRSGFALFTASAVEALGLDPEGLGMSYAEESIEHFGRVATHTLDLEAHWQTESGARRIDIGDADLVLDLATTVPADPAVVWAHLTSPTLRPRWEGPIVFDEALVGGRRGVGTTVTCVTGRLATLEEVVDWQPYDHVGWRLAVPDLGPVAATADLEAASGGGTALRIRWEHQGDGPVDATVVNRVRAEREAAFARLGTILSA